MIQVRADAMVRMGELEVSSSRDAVLSSIGLGSCIGLVLMEPRRPLAGLAHIMLPDSNGDAASPVGKFADRAVPALLKAMAGIGAVQTRLHAVLVGGAQMFSFGGTTPTLDIGRRNEEATRAALAGAGIGVRAAATGGSKGRTVRVCLESGRVLVREPGGPEVELYPPAGDPR